MSKPAITRGCGSFFAREPGSLSPRQDSCKGWSLDQSGTYISARSSSFTQMMNCTHNTKRVLELFVSMIYCTDDTKWCLLVICSSTTSLVFLVCRRGHTMKETRMGRVYQKDELDGI